MLRTVSRTCRDINTTVKSKELVQFAHAFTVPAHTGTQVTINTSTAAHTQSKYSIHVLSHIRGMVKVQTRFGVVSTIRLVLSDTDTLQQ